jgi:putative photosynthetic complex assembly protein 2
MVSTALQMGMTDTAIAVLFALVCWWFGTGIILLLNRLPAHSFRWSLGGWTVLLFLSLWGVQVSMASHSVSNAFIGFGSVIVMWGWHELAFLTGSVTGPRRGPLDPDARGWVRLRQSIAVMLHHELALLANFGLLIAMQSGQPNHLAVCTFALLWCMRVSAKFNLYFGVPRTGADYLPQHLKYLASYLVEKPVGLWLAFSTGLACCMWVWMLVQAQSPSQSITTGWVLLASLLGLAIVEHALMVLPVPLERVWAWALERQHVPVFTAPAPLESK